MSPDTTTTPQNHAQELAQALLDRFAPLQVSEVLRDLKQEVVNTLRERRDQVDKEAKELEEAIKQLNKL